MDAVDSVVQFVTLPVACGSGGDMWIRLLEENYLDYRVALATVSLDYWMVDSC